jgi:hypothetical protein
MVLRDGNDPPPSACKTEVLPLYERSKVAPHSLIGANVLSIVTLREPLQHVVSYCLLHEDLNRYLSRQMEHRVGNAPTLKLAWKASA